MFSPSSTERTRPKSSHHDGKRHKTVRSVAHLRANLGHFFPTLKLAPGQIRSAMSEMCSIDTVGWDCWLVPPSSAPMRPLTAALHNIRNLIGKAAGTLPSSLSLQQLFHQMGGDSVRSMHLESNWSMSQMPWRSDPFMCPFLEGQNQHLLHVRPCPSAKHTLLKCADSQGIRAHFVRK